MEIVWDFRHYMRYIVFSLFAIIFAATFVIAQDAAPALTEIEQLKQQNIILMAQASRCQADASQREVLDRASQLKQDIEKAHPGFSFDIQTGLLTEKK